MASVVKISEDGVKMVTLSSEDKRLVTGSLSTKPYHSIRELALALNLNRDVAAKAVEQLGLEKKASHSQSLIRMIK